MTPQAIWDPRDQGLRFATTIFKICLKGDKRCVIVVTMVSLSLA